ncbi:PAS domain S-box protein [Desulfococcaceae bacterium HSG9]|nr:PAS domain S-box protein [Desulfococcaceae bacterium HSG9]
MKFSNKLSLVSLITGMFVLILLSFTIYQFNYRSIIKSQFMYTKSIADEVSGDIDQLLYEKVKTALTLANTPIIINELETGNFSYTALPDEKRKEAIKLLDEKWKLTKDPADNFILQFTDNKVSRFLKSQQAVLKGEYGEIFLTDKSGALVASTSKLSTFAHGHKYWWLGAYNNGEGAVFFDDRGYDDSVGGYVLGLVVPIRKGTEIIGVLKCNLNILGSISKLVVDTKDSLIGKLKLIRSGGMVVFEEGFEPLSTQIHAAVFKRLKNKNYDSFVINDSGEKYLVGLSEIKLTKGEKGYGFGGTFESIDHKKGNTGESWYVICCRQMSVALAPATELIKAIVLIGTVIIVILVAVSQLSVRKIATPLARLDKATEKIGKGDFKYRIDMIRKDEFGNLARSFNNMAVKLQNTTTSLKLLENEVKRRKQTEKALRKSEEKYRFLIENQTDMVVKFDIEGRLLFVSPSYCTTFDKTKDELIGKKFIPMIHEDDRETVAKAIADVYKPPYTGYVEERAMTKDGWRWMAWLNTAVLNEQGEVDSIVAVGRDINDHKLAEEERAKLEAQLRQQQKLKSIGTLAGGVAHEINNPINGVMNYAQLIVDQMDKDNPLAEYASEIIHETERVAVIVRNLLKFARQEKQSHSPARISDIVEATLTLIKTVIRHDQITLETDIPDGLPEIKCRSQQIQQVLMNLLTNARDALNERYPEYDSDKLMTVTVRPFEKAGRHWLRTTVEDRGAGIPEEIRERLFDPFYTTKDRANGTGLGLSISQGIIHDHCGELFFECERGEYTRFHLDLPVDNGWSLGEVSET